MANVATGKKIDKELKKVKPSVQFKRRGGHRGCGCRIAENAMKVLRDQELDESSALPA